MCMASFYIWKVSSPGMFLMDPYRGSTSGFIFNYEMYLCTQYELFEAKGRYLV